MRSAEGARSVIVPQEPYIILKLPPAIKHHNYNRTRKKQQSKSYVSHARFRVNEERQKGVKLPKKISIQIAHKVKVEWLHYLTTPAVHHHRYYLEGLKRNLLTWTTLTRVQINEYKCELSWQCDFANGVTCKCSNPKLQPWKATGHNFKYFNQRNCQSSSCEKSTASFPGITSEHPSCWIWPPSLDISWLPEAFEMLRAWVTVNKGAPFDRSASFEARLQKSSKSSTNRKKHK